MAPTWKQLVLEGDIAGGYTDALARAACIAATISDNDLTHAPDGNSVFDALALKAPIASPTFTGIVTMNSSVIIPDGGTIGQAAGPLLTFDDTNNYLEITGCKVGIGTTVPAGSLHVVNSAGLTSYFDGDGACIRIRNKTATCYRSDFSVGDSGLWVNAYDDISSVYLPMIFDFDTHFNIRDSGVSRFYIDTSGNIGIGTTTPGAVLHLKAGTTTALSAPLKLTSGNLLTTAEAGAIEFLTDKFYGTITTGPARKTFAFLESPSFTTPTLGAALATSVSIDGHILDSNEWHFLDGQDQAVKIASSPTFVNIQITGHTYFDAEVDNGNSGNADTIDWTAGNCQKSTLTGYDVVFTFTAPSGPCRLSLKLIQDAAGTRTVTWPATVLFPGNVHPTLSIAVGAVDVLIFYFDGTNYYGVGFFKTMS